MAAHRGLSVSVRVERDVGRETKTIETTTEDHGQKGKE